MARPGRHLAVCLLALCAAWSAIPAIAWAATPPPPGYRYVSPLPGTTLILPATNLIVRPGVPLDPASLDPLETVTLEGTLTGAHPGQLRLSDDGETLVFRPASPFLPGESVTCRIAPGIRAMSGATFPAASFVFHIVGARPAPANALQSILDERMSPAAPEPAAVALSPSERGATSARGEPPAIHVVTPGATAPGDVFVSDLRFDDAAYPSHLLQVRNDGSLAFQRALPARAFDFKRQGDRLTYFDAGSLAYVALDPLHAAVDSFRCGNGYETDVHELVLLPNGHALVMAYDPERFDMSQVVVGGRADALVTGLIVQELDREKDVVFQWRSWDHFSVTDATHTDFTRASIDFCHGNAIEPDHDGNLLLSSRHMDEITKIDRSTGEIVWRLGGRNNQFAFVGDGQRFSHQHAVRRLPNGNLLLFDNGYYHTPQQSRAVEYALDESRMTATLVWQYRPEPGIFGFAMGNAQRLPNGNTLIGWGSTNPSVTEVTPDGRVAYELDLPPSVFSYRAFRFEWPPVKPVRASVHPAVVTARGAGWVNAEIQPDGFDPASLDVATITLAGIPAENAARDGATGVTARFPRAAVAARLHPGTNRVALEGSLRTGERIRGTVELRLVSPSSRARAPAWRAVSRPGEWPLRVATGSSGAPADLALFDAQGRLVHRWNATPDAAGVVAWDGQSASGGRLAAGVYFIRAARAPNVGVGARVLLLP